MITPYERHASVAGQSKTEREQLLLLNLDSLQRPIHKSM